MKALEQVLSDIRGDAAVLRTRGHLHDADLMDTICDDVSQAAELYITWLNEPDAKLYSGLAERTLRRRFHELLDADNARYGEKGERIYRAAALPRRPALAAARNAARLGKHLSSAAPR